MKQDSKLSRKRNLTSSKQVGAAASASLTQAYIRKYELYDRIRREEKERREKAHAKKLPWYSLKRWLRRD